MQNGHIDDVRAAVRALNSASNTHERGMVDEFIDLWTLFNESLNQRGHEDIERVDRIALFGVYASNYGIRR